MLLAALLAFLPRSDAQVPSVPDDDDLILLIIAANKAPGAAFTIPSNNAQFGASGPGASIPLTVSASDPEAKIAKVEIFVGSTSIKAFLPNGGFLAPGSFSHTDTGRPPGSYVYKVVVTDHLNKKAEAAVAVTVSANTPPVVATVGSNTQSAYVGNLVPISVSVTDAQGQPITVQFFDGLSGAFIGNGLPSGSTHTLNWSASTEGVHSIRAVASDGIDQTSTTFVVAVMRPPAATGVYSSKATSTVGSIAGTFAVSESGAATYSIPIPVPPGAAGVQPALALSYSSQSGNGPLGMGWGVSGVSTITRCPATVATNGQRNGINFDNIETNDAYCMDGQRLVAVDALQVYGAPPNICDPANPSNNLPRRKQEYRTELDSYAKVIAYEDSPCLAVGPSRFEVHTKSGQLLIFGVLSANTYGDSDYGVSVTSWPTEVNQPGRVNTVKLWPLVRSIDRAGNFIRYEYCGTSLFPAQFIQPCNQLPQGGLAGDVPNVGAFPPTEHYLKRVLYGGRINPDPGSLQVVSPPIANVTLVYGERGAQDQQRAFDSGGGETTLTKYLRSITTSVDGTYGQSYVFAYEGSTATNRVRLASVTQCAGGIGAGVTPNGPCLAPTTFNYTPTIVETPGFHGPFVMGPQIGGNNQDANAAGDLDGDGRTDLIYVADNTSIVRVALSSSGYSWTDRSLGISSVSRGSERYLADFNGDGKADLVLRASDGSFRFCDLRLGTSATTADCKNPSIPAAAEDFYLQGDFDGDGRIDFLLFRGMVNNVYSWDVYLGDPTTGVKTTPITITNLPNTFSPSALEKHFAVGDFNGDGRADLIFRKAASVCNVPLEPPDNFKCSNSSVKWNVCFSRPGSTPGPLQFNCGAEVDAGNGLLEKSITIDFNGDGLADLAYPAYPNNPPAGADLTHWNICLSAGDGSFQRPNAPPPPPSTLYSTSSLCKIVPIFQAQPSDVVFGDFDGDGKSDMARHISGSTWRVCLARTDGASSAPNNVSFQCANRSGGMDPNGSVADNILSGDFNGDGKTDIFSYRNAPFQMALAPAGTPDLLRRVENGLHAVTQIDYLPLTNSDVYSKGTGVTGADEVVIQSPLYVVRSTQESNGVVGTFDHSYSYTGLKGATNGRGLLGFLSRTITDSSGLQRITEYNQSVVDWWKAGRPSRVQTISSSATGSVVLSDAKNDWRLLAHEWPQVYRVHLLGTLEAKRDLDNSTLPCSRTMLYDPANGIPQVDIYGNVLLTVTETGTACNVNTGSFTPDGFKKVTTNTYAPVNPAGWQIGRLARASVQHIAPGKLPVTRTSAFTYHNLSGGYCGGASAPNANLCSEVVEPDEAGTSNMRLETRYEYDAWGNVATTRVYFQEGLDTVERRTTVTFDSNGRFPQRIAKKNVRAATEAGEHVETRTHDARTGGVTSVRKYFGMNESDPRSIITTTFLDDFGRVVGERTSSDDDNKLAEVDATWNAEPPGTNIAYSITTVAHTGARTKVYYDTLQREVTRDIRGFMDQQNTRVITTYDARGRKATVSKPAGNGTMTTAWGYDELDRAVTETTSGNGGLTSTVTITPKGLVTVTRRSNGTYHDQKTIAQRDSQGQITSVAECLAHANQATGEDNTAACAASRQTVVTTYGYDAIGNVVSIRTPSTPTNPAGLERIAEFDKRGRKKWSIDPDEGRTDFTYSGIGELTERRYQQIAGHPITTTFIYDDLGRMYLEKTLNNGVAAYERRFDYDVCSGQPRVNGRLCSTTQLRDQTHFLVEDHFADRYGRTYRSSRVEGGVRDDTYTLFDPQGRPSQTIHPSLQGFAYEYVPNGPGALQRIRDARNSSIIHWEANARHDDGQIQTITLGGVTVTKSYDGFGRPSTINVNNGTLQNAAYTFDPAGNLRSRVDTPNGLGSQTFTYDSLHRVISGGGVTMAYDDAGNVSSRDGASYTYQTGSNRISNGNSYTFDEAGNVKTAPGGLTASWTAENLPLSISKGGQGLSWSYDVNRKRYKEVSTATGITEYFPGMERVKAPDGSVRHKHLITAPEGVVGVAEWIVASNGTTTSDRRYWLRDHLGSTVGTFDAAGNRQETFGYSVWGQRTGAVTVNGSYTQHGFTGHEMLDEVGLVHMDGRIYDPAIGRFLSPDPVVEAPYNGQSWNRYSYVFNNPLSATDPTGYSSWWVDWRRPIGAIAAIAVLGPGGAFGSGGVFGAGGMGVLSGQSAIMASTAAAGFAAGGISGGNVQSALQGAMFAAANYAVGAALGATPDLIDKVYNVAGHAVVGCMQQSSAGGSCRSGALSGGFSAAAGFIWQSDGFAHGLARSVVVGAVASSLSGDTAQNGALTASFDYLFNELTKAGKANMQHAEQEGMRMLRAEFGNVDRFAIVEKPTGYFQFEKGKKMVHGIPDAIVIDKHANTIMLCEFKGGMCSSYTPAQREYIGKEIKNVMFLHKPGMPEHMSGMFTKEMKMKILAPTVFAEEGSRVAKSSATKRMTARGGRLRPL